MDFSAQLRVLATALALLSTEALAGTPPVEEIDWDFDQRAAWEEPVFYSARVMGLGITGLVSLDLHDSDPSRENFLSALRSPAPRPDDDGPLFNFVLHPLWGSETYLRARSADFSMRDSFAFSMGASVTWEYLIESWTEHPSQQDLVYTTGLGWMVGEARYRLLQTADEKYHALVDPLYTALQHLDLSADVDAQGKVTPIVKLNWSI